MSLNKIIISYLVTYPEYVYKTLKSDTQEIIWIIGEGFIPFLIYLGKMICLSRIYYWNTIRYRFNKTRNYIKEIKKEIIIKKLIILNDLDPKISLEIDRNTSINIDQTIEIIQSAEMLAIPWYNQRYNGIETYTCISTVLAAQIIRSYTILTTVSDMPLISKYQALCDLEYASVCLKKILSIDETISLTFITLLEFTAVFIL